MNVEAFVKKLTVLQYNGICDLFIFIWLKK